MSVGKCPARFHPAAATAFKVIPGPINEMPPFTGNSIGIKVKPSAPIILPWIFQPANVCIKPIPMSVGKWPACFHPAAANIFELIPSSIDLIPVMHSNSILIKVVPAAIYQFPTADNRPVTINVVPAVLIEFPAIHLFDAIHKKIMTSVRCSIKAFHSFPVFVKVIPIVINQQPLADTLNSIISLIPVSPGTIRHLIPPEVLHSF